ncbi:NAD-dependent epimerase/dehydratase family protein [bacterium]|nr:NAD-dependent epimerase/dehydratase family protein [bacterium]
MSKILVTGGAGFIGSNVVDALLDNEHEVVVLDNLSTGFHTNINPKVTFYNVDIRDENKVRRIFELEKPDFVNHHAAQMDVHRSTREPIFDAQCNILGSLNLIIQSVATGVKKFIYASTGGAIYGEPKYLPVDENHPINPISQYGISKHTVEHYLYLYSVNHGLKYTVLRYPNVYGPRQNPHGEAGVIAIFTQKMLNNQRPTIFGDGNQTRDYTFVSDIVEANIFALTKGDNTIYNIGTGIEISVQQIFDSLKAILNEGAKEQPIYGDERIGEIQRICLDATKAKRELEWIPKTRFHHGLKRTVEYYQHSK